MFFFRKIRRDVRAIELTTSCVGQLKYLIAFGYNDVFIRKRAARIMTNRYEIDR